MLITSLQFLLFVFGAMILFYLVPKKIQWMILLAASIAFYVSVNVWGIFLVLVTASTIYGSALWIESIRKKQKSYFKENKELLSREEKALIKEKNNKKRRRILVTTLVLNFGILCVFKYLHFALEQVNLVISVFGGSVIEDRINLIMPLGISFYTFQSTGYLIDVYWENCKPQKNYFKTLLFVSFFPQITQGPISDYTKLSNELFSEHKLSYENFVNGFERMLWGFAKKMVIADYISSMVGSLFENYSNYTGISAFIGTFFYSVQIYADFSGYMDIMCGVCEMFGIRLTENFKQPYFSKSIAEYWRRWHITLGEWFKKYVYYPIGMSRLSKKIGQKTKDKFGKFVGQTIPPTIALIVVWFVTGLWHGASWAYIVWGGVNGLFIIFSMWMEPVYAKVKSALKICDTSRLWQAFQVLRTFVLVTLIKVFPEVGSLSGGLKLWKHIFSNHRIPASLSELLPFVDDISIPFLIVASLTGFLFIHSLVERKRDFRTLFHKLPFAVRIAALTVLFIIIAYIGIPAASEGGFLYANF
ncbi:MAG: MBOAT family protein [Clostridiales bacterium]|nr:MBOAT family protein [Clostridiales bacterium]